MNRDASRQLTIRVAERWFHARAESVRAIEAWQTLIPIPWPTPFLGLLHTRDELVPVLDERALDCNTAAQRARILICSLDDLTVAVAAAEVAFEDQATVATAVPLEPALRAASNAVRLRGGA